ncbi:DUF2062 domain-containing protein [Porticoccus sp.]|jgi:uncharacterized protein|nr:DUF2062 domain-containing protein [Gammaproteobacteria bacterium]MDA7737685.1 DUF2062 domain-containing protein [Porticoccus sp.]MCH9842912.1 DUF2062 domain-containing protein [Gammaproteobacteria bacterium]MDC0412465.1 DUF2062 domain-containing protein [Porticoccus sp.]MDC0888222.1 DUF2062 domain-containing protein [Porticoccus sp.]
MPKKILGRWLPAYSKIKKSPALHWMGPIFARPNLFHINRASVSTSFFIGIFVAFLPIPGQTLIAAFLALLFSSNLPIAVALVWISNPLTIAPLFIFTYGIGVLLLGMEFIDFTLEFSWSWIITQGKLIWLPLLTGSFITGLVCGSLGYILINLLWKWKVQKNWVARQGKREDCD